MSMPTSRRDFVVRTAGAASAAAIAARSLSRVAHAAGGDTLRVGLVGCGGRGTGAAVNALSADSNVKLTAMGDLFPDMLQSSLKGLQANGEIAPKLDVPADRQFTGFDAYQGVIDNCDVVCLCTTPYFRPMQLAYAVEQGKHCFVEKPVATDPVGVRSVLESCRRAHEKGLSVVSGLCYRYHTPKRQTIERVHGGEIGPILTAETYYLTGQLWHRGRKPEWTEMEYQIRNWLYFDWLSGDHIAEQHIHSLDKIAWALGDQYPLRATSLGGRSQRIEPEWGNVYDHFSTVYEYEGGLKVYSYCRQQNSTTGNVSDQLYGTEGTAYLQDHRITKRNGERWAYRPDRTNPRSEDMYQTEHDEWMASIRAGKPINNGEYMAKSTLMAILGRLAAYTGRTLKWDEVAKSNFSLAPDKLAFGDAPVRPVAVPGKYTF